MNRRAFITLLGGAAAWPLAARAQPAERVRRIGVLTSLIEDDAQSQARVAAFRQGLHQSGWTDGGNLRVDYRWGERDPERMRRYAVELIGLAPDAVLAGGSEALAAFRQATSRVPVVFVNVADPVGAGFVDSLPRPGGNATGFLLLEFGVSPKWLELLKEFAPNVERVAIIRDAAIPSGIGQFDAIRTAAATFGVEVVPVGMRDAGAIEHAVAAFAQGRNGGMVVASTPAAVFNRGLIVALAARYRLPTVYPLRLYAADGGLIAYGPDNVDQYRRAAGYVDRILKGEKPADLPVQAPIKYELVINLKTAKALGLEIPPTLLARADEVIE